MAKPQTGPIEVDISARQRHVVGSGPRIEALPNDGIEQDMWDLVNKVRAGAGAGPTNNMPDYMRTMLKHREIFQCQMDMGAVLFNGAIPTRERELAILRCGWLCRAPYEWGEHVNIGKRFGLSDAEIERVTNGSSAEGWNRHEAAILTGVEELIADQAMSDETWETLAESWTEKQLIEFPMMVGQYVATAFIQNSLRIRLSDENAGLAAR